MELMLFLNKASLLKADAVKMLRLAKIKTNSVFKGKLRRVLIICQIFVHIVLSYETSFQSNQNNLTLILLHT